MRQLWRISPSACASITGDKGCERKCGLNWVTPRREETEKQRLGTAVHKVQQDYLNTGKAHDRNDKAGRMAMAGLPYMPPPRSGRAEGESEIRISGINYVTIVDYEGPSDLLPGAPPGLPATLDHKTSSDPAQYGLWGDAAFLADPQALTYAARALVKYRDAASVFARWLYYDTRRKSKALPSDSTMERGAVVEAFGRIVHPAAVRLIELQNQCPPHEAPEAVRLAWANTLPANTDACGAYGGCEYERSGACQLTALEKFSACVSGLDTAKIKIDKPEPSRLEPERAAPVVEGRVADNKVDLFAKLSAGLGAAKTESKPKTPSARPPAVVQGGATVVAPDALAALKGAIAGGSQGGSKTDALAALKAATGGGAPKNDPVNAPERPATVASPAKGGDLTAHLKAVAASGALKPEDQAQVETALAGAESAMGPTGAQAGGEPKPEPKADPTPTTARSTKAPTAVEKSKAKLDAALAIPPNPTPVPSAGSISDEELGRAIRVVLQAGGKVSF